MNITVKKSLRILNWAKSKLKNHAIILGYHRISEAKHDPYFMNVSMKNFSQQLEIIKKVASPVSLKDLVKKVKENNITENLIAVTFDDGYSDNYYRAKPLLEKYNIPATVFVSTGKLDSEFWWDELERLILNSNISPEELHFKYKQGSFFWKFNEKEKITPSESLFKALYRIMHNMDESVIYEILEQLKEMMNEHEIGKYRYRAMTEDELKLLTSTELIDIGSHTVSHNFANTSNLNRLNKELKESKKQLQEIIQKQVIGFSYPNGHVIPGSENILKENGYLYACISYTNYTFKNTNRYSLPRFWVPDHSGDKFEKWLTGWRN